MPKQSGTLESIGAALGHLLASIEERLSQGQVLLLFAELGMQFPEELETKSAFMDALEKTSNSAGLLPDALIAMANAIEAEDQGAIISRGLELFNLIKDIILSVESVATELKNVGGTLPGVDPGDVTAFANELPTRLIDYLVIRNLEAVPVLAETLEGIGAIGRQDIISPEFEFTKRELKLDDLLAFLQSPGERLKELYSWGAPDFDGLQILQKLENFLVSNGLPAIVVTSGPLPILDAVFGEISAKTDIDPKGLMILINEPIGFDNTTPIIQDDWKLEFVFNGQLTPNVQIIIQPNGNVTFQPPSGELQGGAAITWTGGRQDGEPYILLGEVSGSRIEVKQFIARGGVDFIWNSSSGKAEGAFHVGGEVKGGKVIIDFNQGDGFLSQILSGIGLESEFDLGLGFSSQQGIYFIGSATLEIQLPLHVDLGVVELNAFVFSVGIQGLTFPISASADIKAKLGPLTAIVEQMGLKADLSLPPDRKGNLGPVDLFFSFKPPNGVGMSIDAGAVKGGGYLFFDFDKEEYAGVLELDLSGIVSVKAIGLITTRLPDGSKGFSLLLIVTAEFGSPIQLGFGFTLSGVGGLLGLNRTMRLEAIATGIRDGGINSIMFPQNVVENVSRIISDLKNYFPVEDGTFLIGPMVKIGWGTPNLVTVSLGIIIEIPGNIAILGVLKVVLPDEEAALIVIQVNFIGAIEFDKKRLWFFAAIFESRVLYITLEGEMGLLVGWGDDASFVVSVGGFHPAFNPPPLPFGAIARIAISLLNTDFARIRVEGYFAVTSNSVQFGAAVEIFFGVSAFNINGHLAFDALFRFSPFYFIITISASLSVKVFGIGLFSVRMRGSLEGPTPWHVEGTGSISLLFFDIDVDFSHTWGSEAETTLPPINVMPLLVSEYGKSENWLAALPPNNKLLVSLRSFDQSATDLVLHPVGSLKISQRAVPLGLTIHKVGNQKPSDANYFDVTVNTSGIDEKGKLEERFAVGQYFDKDDSELLSAKSFEPMKSGIELSVAGEQYHAPLAVKRVVRYEKIIIDTNYKRFVRKFYTWFGSLFDLFLKGNAVSKSTLSFKHQKELNPFDEQVQVGPTLYTVAYNQDNTAFNEDAMSFTSQVEAQEFMNQQVVSDANLAQQLHVIPQVEMQRAE
jgi:hypothetical protein